MHVGVVFYPGLALPWSLLPRHADKDGHISVEDLDASLEHVAVCCPRTRCIYRRPHSMAKELLKRADGASEAP